MPNRILREGILSSGRVDALSCGAEVFYRRLMSAVDDFGLFTAHLSLLRAALYPLKLDRVRDEDIRAWLDETAAAGLVRVYEADGKRCLQLLKFNQQVRAKRSKYPLPPCAADAMHPIVDAKHPIADAHLDGDVDGGGDVKKPCFVVCTPGNDPPARRRAEHTTALAKPAEAGERIGRLCQALRAQSIDCAPHWKAWKELLCAYSDGEIIAAGERAHAKKPGERLHLNYLLPLLRDRSPPSPAGRSGEKAARIDRYAREAAAARGEAGLEGGNDDGIGGGKGCVIDGEGRRILPGE